VFFGNHSLQKELLFSIVSTAALPRCANARKVNAGLAAGHDESADDRQCARFSETFPKHGNHPSTLRTHVQYPRDEKAS
jgi:hypothetical protein